jgi:16S rRNA (guanine527-N7)-methyltransferase
LELIRKYFPELSPKQERQFLEFAERLVVWNGKVNLISRKDTESIYEKHILHSLAIAKFTQFNPEAQVLDIGTGGGFPGLPLAIFFPDTQFHLVDSIAKKVKVVQDIAAEMQLENVRADISRVELLEGTYDFAVTRAVAPLVKLNAWAKNKISKEHKHALKNGIIALKGGDLNAEMASFGRRVEVLPLSNYFVEEFFETKSIVYLA